MSPENATQRPFSNPDHADPTPAQEENRQEPSDEGASEYAQSTEHTAWFVESVVNGAFDGWWTGAPKGRGGWITTDPTAAKRFTKADAQLVASVLDYFPSPFPYSHWIATDHLFCA